MTVKLVEAEIVHFEQSDCVIYKPVGRSIKIITDYKIIIT